MKGYRIYFPQTNKVEIHRYIVVAPEVKPKFKDNRKLNVDEEVEEIVLLDMEEQIPDDDLEEPTEDLHNISETTTKTVTNGHSLNETNDNLTSDSVSTESSTNLNIPEYVNMDRRGRIIKKPEWLKNFDTSTDYVLFNTAEEPITWEKAMNGDDAHKWKAAVDKKMESLLENNTWTVIPYPNGKNIIESKWVLKSVSQFKARLVARGFQQNLDNETYDNVFSPVAKLCTFRILLVIACRLGVPIFQMDVQNAFLHGDISEEIYVTAKGNQDIQFNCM